MIIFQLSPIVRLKSVQIGVIGECCLRTLNHSARCTCTSFPFFGHGGLGHELGWGGGEESRSFISPSSAILSVNKIVLRRCLVQLQHLLGDLDSL